MDTTTKMHNLHLRSTREGSSTYFVSKDSAPFPSYCSAPEKAFPARWTAIPDARRPVSGLRCPRIRVGPNEVEGTGSTRFSALQTIASQEKQKLIAELNLMHQALGDPYQFVALKTFLSLNSRVTVLCLSDNELSSLIGIELPDTEVIHLSRNAFCTFEALPPLPACTTMHITNNFIGDTVGLDSDKYPRLRVLTLKGNPMTRKAGYVGSVAGAICTLKFLDNMPL